MSLTSKLTTIAAAGAGGSSGWYLAFRSSSTSDSALSVRVDSNNDIYVCGQARDSSFGSGRSGFMAKISADASFIWSKIYDSIDTATINDFDLDGTSFIYTTGSLSTTIGDIYNIKINASTGNTVFVKKTSGNSIDSATRCAWDSYNNSGLIIAGRTFSNLTSQTGAYFGAVSSNGSINDRMQKGSYTNLFSDTCVSGNVYYYVGTSSAKGLYNNGIIQRAFNGFTSSVFCTEIDSNAFWDVCAGIGNTDAIVSGRTAGLYRIMRINSAINQVWRKSLSFNGTSAPVIDLVTDSSDNIYLLNSISGGPVITKLDSNGGVLWSNKLSNSQGTITPTRICVTDDEEFIHVAGIDNFSAIGATTGGCSFVVKLPTNGSGTGTSGDFTYEAVSTVVSDGGSLSKVADALTLASASLGTSNYANTTASVTYGTNLTDL